MWGGEGSLGKHETGGELEGMNASGFLEGKGIKKKKKYRHERDTRDTGGRQKPWDPSPKACLHSPASGESHRYM